MLVAFRPGAIGSYDSAGADAEVPEWLSGHRKLFLQPPFPGRLLYPQGVGLTLAQDNWPLKQLGVAFDQYAPPFIIRNTEAGPRILLEVERSCCSLPATEIKPLVRIDTADRDDVG